MWVEVHACNPHSQVGGYKSLSLGHGANGKLALYNSTLPASNRKTEPRNDGLGSSQRDHNPLGLFLQEFECTYWRHHSCIPGYCGDRFVAQAGLYLTEIFLARMAEVRIFLVIDPAAVSCLGNREYVCQCADGLVTNLQVVGESPLSCFSVSTQNFHAVPRSFCCFYKAFSQASPFLWRQLLHLSLLM